METINTHTGRPATDAEFRQALHECSTPELIRILRARIAKPHRISATAFIIAAGLLAGRFDTDTNELSNNIEHWPAEFEQLAATCS